MLGDDWDQWHASLTAMRGQPMAFPLIWSQVRDTLLVVATQPEGGVVPALQVRYMGGAAGCAHWREVVIKKEDGSATGPARATRACGERRTGMGSLPLGQGSSERLTSYRQRNTT